MLHTARPRDVLGCWIKAIDVYSNMCALVFRRAMPQSAAAARSTAHALLLRRKCATRHDSVTAVGSWGRLHNPLVLVVEVVWFWF